MPPPGLLPPPEPVRCAGKAETSTPRIEIAAINGDFISTPYDEPIGDQATIPQRASFWTVPILRRQCKRYTSFLDSVVLYDTALHR
jgi:hypothetical protein